MVSGFVPKAKQGSLLGTGSSPRSHSRGGRGSDSGMGFLRLWSLVLADTSEEELLDGTSDGFGLWLSLPDVSESGLLCRWSSPSAAFVGLSGSGEQLAVGAESAAASGSGFGGGSWAFSLQLDCRCWGPPPRGPGPRSMEMTGPWVFGGLVVTGSSPLLWWLF